LPPTLGFPELLSDFVVDLSPILLETLFQLYRPATPHLTMARDRPATPHLTMARGGRTKRIPAKLRGISTPSPAAASAAVHFHPPLLYHL